jgi:hypothetical protein
MSELTIYQSDDGKARVQFRAMDGSLWLSQLQLAELYGVTVANHQHPPAQDRAKRGVGSRGSYQARLNTCRRRQTLPHQTLQIGHGANSMIEQRLDRLGWRMNATPGMTATLEIKTGQKTLLEYLLRPLQSMTQALCER